jgi:hypothetical protein
MVTRTERVFFSQQPSAIVIMLALFVPYLWAFEIKPTAWCTVYGKPQVGPFKYQRTVYGKPRWRVNSKSSSCPKKGEKPLGSVYISYVKCISENFKSTGNQYNIRTIFKTKHILRSLLMKTRLERDPQRMTQCVHSIPCECGRSYSGKTGRRLAMWLQEHRHYLREGLL